MSIVISLSLEVEAQLREKEAIEGIQHGLDDFAAGRSRSFEEFAEEQRRKYNLPIDSVASRTTKGN